MPVRSSGCFTCRKRKIRCDETRPQCQRCGTHGVVCPGYRTDQKAGGIEFKDQTGDTVRRAKDSYRVSGRERERERAGAALTVMRGGKGGSAMASASASASASAAAQGSITWFSANSSAVTCLGEEFLRGYYGLSPSPPPPVDLLSPGVMRSQLYGTFMDVYLPTNSLRDHFSFYETLVTMSTEQPALTQALDALSLVAVGSMNKDRAVLDQSVRKYGDALSSLGKALARPEAASSDETLAAATVLGNCALYDEIGKHENVWGKHVTGGQQLIAARGPKNLNSKLALLLFSTTRHGALIWSLIERKAPYMALPEWRELAFETSIQDSSTLFYDAAIQIPGLLQRYDQLGDSVALSVDNIDDLLRDCEHIEQSLRDWLLNWEIRFAFEGVGLYEERPIDDFTTFTSSVQDRTFETAFWFSEFPIAYLASVYWLSMFHLRLNIQSLHKLRHELEKDWYPTPESAAT
ncbi:hypothetical protein B0A55_08315 [Friedmanniomyces simplex]|uniref:Zn(2)-C6 fungal-type domain-containing protein n=1 Tax=Friedmanniomyces simplex TaxID=329884 RepID=A0A4U0WTH5_9PEZI|nr:hypothetical protein B0A55_08315 [Friedmanniomyces simplex]